MPLMVDCIQKEIALRKHEMTDSIETLYFGGGTPSIVQPEMIANIVEAIERHYHVEISEFTIECNPDDINLEKLRAWKDIGVNRLSIGIQSFFDEHLIWMNRSHNATQSEKSITDAQSIGFDNLTVDLIYGFSGLSDNQWIANMEKLIKHNVPHISAYAMTIENKTALGYHFNTGKYIPPVDDQVNHQFDMLMNFLNEHGYKHYEISNFAKSGFKAKHNTGYWRNKPYLGFGPGAHSYLKDRRISNISHNIKYIKCLEQDILPMEIEQLSTKDKYHEYILVRLRTCEGISEQVIRNQFSEFFEHFRKEINPFMPKYIDFTNDHYILNRQGKHLADYITSSLFIE